MKNDCSIVKDLLPNYIENLVSEETKEYVENHVNSCSKCRQVLEIIQDDATKTKNNYNQEEKIEMKHFSKCRRKIILLKSFAFVLWAIILIVIILFARKFYILNKIMTNIGKNNEITNYRVHSITLDGSTSFLTNGKVVIYGEGKQDDQVGTIYYMDMDENHIAYVVDTENKTYREWLGVPYIWDNPLTDDLHEEMTFKDKMIALFTWEISSEKIDGKECYYIRKNINEIEPGGEYEIWIDKENYCKVKATAKEDSRTGKPEKTIYYHVEINGITDYDVSFERLFPDFSTYEKVE